MPSYISKSACRGRRPAHLKALRYNNRSDLVARLLRERSVARFVVAPPGYGKTTLVLEYAETVFGLKHVFWVCATSPCFIRDLDAGVLGESCRVVDGELELVVFEDVPRLDDQRSKLFSQEVDRLLEWGVEVVVTLTPMSDSYALLQRDRVRITSRDLLLQDAELDTFDTSSGHRILNSDREALDADRVVGLYMATKDEARDKFLVAALGEDMPMDMLLAYSSMLVLQKGKYDDLELLGRLGDDTLSELAENYPHLGLDEPTGLFETWSFDIPSIAHALKGKLHTMAMQSGFSSRDALALEWAGALVACGKVARACACMREFATVAARGGWMLAHRRDIIVQAAFLEAIKVLDSLQGARSEGKLALSVLRCVCLSKLSDHAAALAEARKSAYDSSLPASMRSLSLMELARFSSGEVSDRASNMLAELVAESGEQPFEEDSEWYFIARGHLALRESPTNLARYWVSLHSAGAPNSSLLVLASWMFDAVSGDMFYRNSERFADALQAMALYVHEQLVPFDADHSGYFALCAGLSFERMHAQGILSSVRPLPTQTMLELRRGEMAIVVQRRAWTNMLSHEKNKRMSRIATKPDSYVDKRVKYLPPANANVPLLNVRLFGKVEVELGGQAVDLDRYRRNNVRTLLVLLVANHGREISIEALAESFWPASSPSLGKRNFASLLSQLKKAITLADGSCPYLIKHASCCSVAERYVVSDLYRFEDICRELLFGEPDVQMWAELYKEIERDFTDEIAPGDQGNDLVRAVVRKCRERLLDALVTAAVRLSDEQGQRLAIWYARSAVEIDSTREDAYAALMRAQMSCGQRTAAMATYMRCRRVLSEELGIDPSPETQALYEELLDMPDDGVDYR